MIKRSLLALLAVVNVSVAQEFTPFSQIKLTLADSQSLPLSDVISLKLVTDEQTQTIKFLDKFKGISAAETADGVEIKLQRHTQYTGVVAEQHSNRSFVIDLNEPSVEAFVASYKDGTAATTNITSILDYVDQYITDDTYIHGFNIASQVAATKSGDCTEHAVLTTALARAVGLPARVVFGTVIVESDDSVTAYGHAWSEINQHGQWLLADAALHKANFTQKFYIPSGTLESEGPSYAWSLLNLIAVMPESIQELTSE